MTWQARSQRRAELPADWPAIRLTQLQRDKWTCQHPDCHAYANQVDHTGDKQDHAKLQSLCETHHKQKTAQQGADARAARRARARLPITPHPGMIEG